MVHSPNHKPIGHLQTPTLGVRLLSLIGVGSTVLFLLVVLYVRVDSHRLIGSSLLSPQFLCIFSFNNIYEHLTKD